METKRTRGAGNIERLPSGKFRYQLKVGGERIIGSSCGTREEAEAAMEEAKIAVLRGTVPAGASLGAWGAAWLERRRTCNADTERGMWRLHVEPCEIAGLPLAEVRQIAEALGLSSATTVARVLQRYQGLSQRGRRKKQQGG